MSCASDYTPFAFIFGINAILSMSLLAKFYWAISAIVSEMVDGSVPFVAGQYSVTGLSRVV